MISTDEEACFHIDRYSVDKPGCELESRSSHLSFLLLATEIHAHACEGDSSGKGDSGM